MNHAATAPSRPTIFAPLAPHETWRDGWEHETFLHDVLSGLSRVQKAVPPKYFYDDAGAALFERICGLPEYYLTRAEAAILAEHGGEIARDLGPGTTLVELGSGSSTKTRQLLDRLEAPAAYVPVDIAAGALHAAVQRLHRDYPGLPVLPVRADFTHTFTLPPAAARAERLAVFFPGSTIGNLEPHEAVLLLRKIRRRLPAGGQLIVGVDVPKAREVLEAAYDDSQGVTAAFNRNLLVRVRNELGSDADPGAFEHVATWNAVLKRIEMHLRSPAEQQVRVDGRTFLFRAGETLHTENSYKYEPAAFCDLAQQAGFTHRKHWQDPNALFSVHLLFNGVGGD